MKLETNNKRRRFRPLALLLAAVITVVAVASVLVIGGGAESSYVPASLSEKSVNTAKGYGVYLDGVFIAAVDGADIASGCKAELVALLAEVCGAPDGDSSLLNDWRTVSGSYHKNSFVDAEGLMHLLGKRDGGFEYTVNDVHGNGTDVSLSVATKTSLTENTEIAYDTVYVPTDVLDVGKEIVVNDGKAGALLNSYSLTYINGVCAEKLFTGSTVVAEPVSAEVWQGTDKKASLMSAGERLMLPHNGVVTSWYGYRILWGELDFHNGIDFAGYNKSCYGDPIYASADGIVTFSGRHGGYGLKIVVSHSSDFATIYAHCSKLLVESGDAVEKGQVIGYIGATGRVTGPHLHYGVTVNGVPVNPKDYLDWSGYEY